MLNLLQVWQCRQIDAHLRDCLGSLVRPVTPSEECARSLPCPRRIHGLHSDVFDRERPRCYYRSCQHCTGTLYCLRRPGVSLTSRPQYTVAKLFEISEKVKTDTSFLPEAQRLQGIVARADYTIAKAGIAGTKYLIEKLYGYGGNPRRPLPPIEAAVAEALWAHPHTQELIKLERELSGKVQS